MAKKKAATESKNRWSWTFIIGLVVTIGIAALGYYEWEKDRKPMIRYVNFEIIGTPGKTPLILKSHFRNLGKTDATELMTDSRLKSGEKYDPGLPTMSQPHATGTVGPGVEMCPTPHEVSLENSKLMMQPVSDRVRIWWHDRVFYKDEDGKPQPIVEICQVWDRTHQTFSRCTP